MINRTKFPLHLTILTILLSLIGAIAPIWLNVAPARSQAPSLISLRFNTPEEEAPSRPLGGEPAGCPCLGCGSRPIALLPPTYLGLTVAARPTFFIYVPLPSQNSRFNMIAGEDGEKQAELLLEDENFEVIFQASFRLANLPGVVSVSLPAEASPLEINKNYHWYFSIVCDRYDRSNDSYAEGWVKRVEASIALIRRLEQTEARDRPALYAEAGIWHETLTTLAQLRYSEPNNAALAAAWAELLESVKLDNIAPYPLIDCCTLEHESLSQHYSGSGCWRTYS